MSKLADALRAIRVFNNWELLIRFGDRGDVAVEYNPGACRVGYAYTAVWSPRPHPKLQRESSRHSFSKEFTGKRRDTLLPARQWAEREFDCTLVPSPFGGYVPRRVLSKAAKEATV